MKKVILGAVSALALSSSAFAADIYRGEAVSYKDAPVHVAPHIWSGFYVGVNGGYAWGDEQSPVFNFQWAPEANRNGEPRNPVRKSDYSLEPEGGFAGLQIGYNVQRSNIVFGLEADIQYSDISDEGKGFFVGNEDNPRDGQNADLSIDWFGTARARLGYAH